MFDHILAKSNGITLQQHLEDVAKIAVCIAQNVGLDPEIARMGAHLHDIGKASPIFQERLKQKNLPPCALVFRHEIASLFFLSLIEDVEKIFSKYQSFVDAGEQLEEGYIETLALYLLEGRVENFRSRLEYLNMIGNDADSVIEAQKFWYYAHSEASWYDTHKTDDAYYGYWSFDTAALCKMRGIYDERFKDLDFFPYDLLVQEDK